MSVIDDILVRNKKNLSKEENIVYYRLKEIQTDIFVFECKGEDTTIRMRGFDNNPKTKETTIEFTVIPFNHTFVSNVYNIKITVSVENTRIFTTWWKKSSGNQGKDMMEKYACIAYEEYIIGLAKKCKRNELRREV